MLREGWQKHLKRCQCISFLKPIFYNRSSIFKNYSFHYFLYEVLRIYILFFLIINHFQASGRKFVSGRNNLQLNRSSSLVSRFGCQSSLQLRSFGVDRVALCLFLEGVSALVWFPNSLTRGSDSLASCTATMSLINRNSELRLSRFSPYLAFMAYFVPQSNWFARSIWSIVMTHVCARVWSVGFAQMGCV